jgi:hypothetical protein
MNAATAGGLLAGSVSVTFNPDAISKQAGVCDFVKSDNPTATLRIEVSLMHSPAAQFAGYLSKCGADKKQLKSIGNEAVKCGVAPNGARVIGRVRDQAFIITLSRAGTDNSVNKAAEIVAGNLF